MPQMVKIAPNAGFSAKSEDDKKAFAAIKAKGVIECDYVTAMENIRHSGGMYAIVAEEAVASTPGPRRLEDMDNDELKAMMLTAGVTPQKQMKRAEIIKSIRLKMDAVTIIDDETGAD